MVSALIAHVLQMLLLSTQALPAPTPTPTPMPTEVRVVAEKVAIPFERQVREDSEVDRGVRVVSIKGIVGEKTMIYEVTVVGAKQASKKLIYEAVGKRPTAEVTLVGTRLVSQCDPNYTGCVPIASDVDCQGGRGNGPAYVRGPVEVVGWDIYGLDGDDDGVACE